LNGMLGCNMDSAMPGLFFVLGPPYFMDIVLKYKQKLDESKANRKLYKIFFFVKIAILFGLEQMGIH